MFAGSGTEKVHSTQITLMQKDGISVVTVLPDYQGPLSPFALIIPVPSDVTKTRVNALKRAYTDRVALVSAPRFAEFWEMDPCSSEKRMQDWERDRKANDATAFLGTMKTDPSKKVAKEMLLDVEAQKKKGEYVNTLVGSAAEVKKWLEGKDYKLPPGADKSFSEYEELGYKFLVMDVDSNLMELVGSDRASLSPIRFWTKEEVTTLPTRFGLPSAAKEQELQIFTMIPGQRMQVTNYETKAIPTNLSVVTEYIESEKKKYNLKEKIGEFYTALHDSFAEKNPNTFLLEYAWPTEDCGKPCPSEPLFPDELLSLGADVFEATLSKDVTRPAPPEATDEEKGKLEGLQMAAKSPKQKRDIKKQWEADRQELAARKALLERNKYILTRLHYRYSSAQMPKDVELGSGAAVTGGVALPEGEFGEADTSVQPADENHFQSRYNGLFPNIKVIKCDDPKPHRWGKSPRTYRGLNKIWVAEDLARRNRKRIDLKKAVLTPVPVLGLAGRTAAVEEKKSDAVDVPVEKEDSGCACSAVDSSAARQWGAWGGLLMLGAFWRRRSTRRA